MDRRTDRPGNIHPYIVIDQEYTYILHGIATVSASMQYSFQSKVIIYS